MKPVAGETYYIKEDPSEYYLQPYTHYSYYKANNVVADILMISAIDDNNYTQTGFVIISANKDATVCTSLTVQNAVGGNSVKITPTKVFGAKGLEGGLLTYRKVTSELNVGDLVVEYWVTPDGLIVTGTTGRTLNNLSDKDLIKKNVVDESRASTIAEFN